MAMIVVVPARSIGDVRTRRCSRLHPRLKRHWRERFARQWETVEQIS